MTAKLTVTKVKLVQKSQEDLRRFGSTKVRMYFSHVGESVMENFLGGRRDRPSQLYREVFPEVIEMLASEQQFLFADSLTKAIADGQIKWSRKAGCSCGCSPAFIVGFYNSFDLFVDVEGPKTNYEAKFGEPLVPVRPLPEESPLEYFVKNLS